MYTVYILQLHFSALLRSEIGLIDDKTRLIRSFCSYNVILRPTFQAVFNGTTISVCVIFIVNHVITMTSVEVTVLASLWRCTGGRLTQNA